MRRCLFIASTLCCSVLALATAVVPGASAGVTQLAALHHDGQTFLTWNAPAGTGWTFRIYSSPSPITSGTGVTGATLVGTVGDSSACDHRLSRLLGVTYGFVTDSLAAPLSPRDGLFVYTPATSSARWYAVTSQAAGSSEDLAIQPGVNALASSVREVVGSPRPVHQRELSLSDLSPSSIYTLWVSGHDTPAVRAMANREGLAFDCAVRRNGGASSGALFVRMHARGNSFLDCLSATQKAGEVVLSLDDPLPNGQNTFWYGYHPAYDVTAAFTPPPTSGVVQDYTLRRVDWTLDWALRTFPADAQRVYAFGYSMGGIGSAQLAMRRPGRVAAVMPVIAKFDFSFLTDPDTLNGFNTGRPLRGIVDQMWGTVASNLPSSDGPPAYELLNDALLASSATLPWLPPIIAFNGRRDDVVGWAEKIGFYHAMRDHDRGGTFFWDERGHYDGNGLWVPMQTPSTLYDYRSDRSFPALSHCDLDSDPGDGHLQSGDGFGTINGFVEWDTLLVDRPSRWETVLRLRALSLSTGTWYAPESCTVDVTPSRTQQFVLSPGESFDWSALRISNGAILQAGSGQADALGRATVRGVRVDSSGTRLTLVNTSWVGAEMPVTRGGLALAVAGNPARGAATLRLAWPRTGDAAVDLLDVSGRRMRELHAGPAGAAPVLLRFDVRGLPAGLYFVRASAAGETRTQRVVVLP